jgi:hypothetical protein
MYECAAREFEASARRVRVRERPGAEGEEAGRGERVHGCVRGRGMGLEG